MAVCVVHNSLTKVSPGRPCAPIVRYELYRYRNLCVALYYQRRLPASAGGNDRDLKFFARFI